MSEDNLYDDEPMKKPARTTLPVPDLEQFVETYIPSKLPMNWHHRLFYDILTSKVVQHDDGKLYLYDGRNKRQNRNILLMAPRFHSKSQCFTINYPLWRIYKDQSIRIMIVSGNDDIAASFNRAIMAHLENNQKLHDELGYLVPQYPKKWGEKALQVGRENARYIEKDPTVAAIGVGGKLISRRADIIILDDPIDIETARTKQMRNKTREWFENVLLPILEDNGILIVVGTAWYRDDLYDALWQDSKFDIKLKLKALMYHEKYLYQHKDGVRSMFKFVPWRLTDFPMALKAQDIFSQEVSLRYHLYENLKGGMMWQDKWSFQKLIAKKFEQNMSSASFMRQYLNEPSTEEEKVFKERDLKRMVDRGVGKHLVLSWENSAPQSNLGYGHLIIAIGVDLAISKSREADNSAIAVWGLTDDRRRVCLWLDYGKWSPDEVKQRVLDAYYNYKPVKVRVENVAFQDMLRQELAQDIPVEGFHTTSSKKFNPETGLAHLAMLLEQDKLVLPMTRKVTEHFDKVKQLLYEMQIYSYDQHDGDLLMASWFALDVLKDFDKKLRDNRGFFNTEALVAQMKYIRAASKVILLSKTFYKIAGNSLVYVFRPLDGKTMFIEPDEPFMIFATREDKSVAYILQKQTNEIVGRIEGDLTAVMFVNLLERASQFFNDAQVVIDRNGEGEAIYMELEKRSNLNLLCFQPDEHGLPVYKEGFKISSATLPIAVDYFRLSVDQLKCEIRDEQLVKEMGDTINVDGDQMVMSFGKGQRIKTIATALWLLDNYENTEKQMPQNAETIKKKKTLQVPYKIFR